MVLVEPSQTLRDYYQYAELELPEPLQNFHQHRFKLSSGKFLRIKDTIRTPEALREWCFRLSPLDVFHQVNPFLSPSTVSYTEFDGKKAGGNISDNIMLGDGVLIFDCDFHERSFNEAKHDALGVIDYLKERGYQIAQAKFTGRGFQILVTNHDLHLPQVQPKARFNLYREKRKPLIEELEKRGIQVDKEISLDPKRIVRTVGTINYKTGCKCTIIRDLEGFTEFSIERLNLEGVAPTSPNGAMTDFFHIEKERVDSRWRRSERGNHLETETKPDKINPIKSTPKPTLYLSTMVIQTLDRQIILLRFKNDVNLEQLKTGLSKFAEQERLAPFIIFRSHKDPEGIWSLSPSAIQTAGMKRLLRRFPKDNASYQKFRRRIVPLPIEYVAQTFGDTNSEIPVSRAHLKYFQHYGLLKFSPRILCGSHNLLSTPIGEMAA